MAHPYARRADKTGSRRANAILISAGGCAGSDQSPFSSAGVADRRGKTSRKATHEADLRAEGGRSAKRYGKVKKADGGKIDAGENFPGGVLDAMRNGRAKDTVGFVAPGSKARKSEYARGGKTRAPKHQVNIAIVNPRHPAPMAAGPSPMAGPPGMPPGMPPGAPVPGMGGPPGMPPPGVMRARGGRAGLPDAGAGSGVARIEKAEWSKRHHGG